ncbi:HEAT repeat [Chamberlinius hualienensis]
MSSDSSQPLHQQASQVDVLIYALLEATNDSKPEVRQGISTALQKLGSNNPNLMLDISLKYLQQNAKLPAPHRTIVLSAMAEVCKGQLQTINPEIAKAIIRLCVEDIISVKDMTPDLQSAASSVVVALGQQFCYEVMEIMHLKFQPGVMPSFFVVQTLADLSVANAYGMVPFLKALLQTALTIFGMIKHDNMRWVIAYALARFSESIIYYIANIDKSPDVSVRKEFFSTELSVAYGTLFNSWLQSKELKIRMVVVEAIGYICQLMSKEKMEEELPRLIPAYLSMYRRHSDPYFISESLSMILQAASSNSCSNLGPLVESIITVLFPQTCTIPDYLQTLAVKNHSEVLRCFTIIGYIQPEQLIDYILSRVDNSNERIRIGSLTVIKQLINTPECKIGDRMATILSGLKSALTETNNKVKKVFAQVIVAFATNGYLIIDSNNILTEFIIQQCALPDEPKSLRKLSDSDPVSNAELRSMCENILHLFVTTVNSIEKIYWPQIVEFLMAEHLTNAAGVICKCASYLGNKLKEEQNSDYEIEFYKYNNLPTPVQLITRLLVLLGHPKVGNDRGVYILKLMLILVPSLEKNLSATWDAAIPKLQQYLEDKLEHWSQIEWEKMILKLLTDSLNEIDRQEWTILVARTFGEQVPLYLNYPDDKNFLFKCLGVAMKKCNKTVVNELLDLIFKNVNHMVAADREGCAAATGYCAATHTDTVLVKLDQLARVDLAKKSGILGFFMDMKGEVEHEIWKATVVLCYGYVAMCAPPGLLTARIETPILRNVNGYFSSAKDPAIRLNLIRMTEMIAVALHPSNLRERIAFRSKSELLKNMEVFILLEKGQPLKSAAISLALDACTALLKLDPVLQCDERLPLLKTCYDTVFPLPSTFAPERAKVERYEEEEEHEVLLDSTLNSLLELLKELFSKEISSINFYSLFVSLEVWIMSARSLERERVLKCVFILSKCFLENLSMTLGGSSSFDTHGAIIARLVPRCTDTSMNVRHLAYSSICNILKIVSRLDGFSADHEDQDIEMVNVLKQNAMQEDPDILYGVSIDLAKVLSNKLSIIQLRQFLDVAMEGLVDSQAHSSSGTCVVLNHVLKNKVGVLQQDLDTLMQLLHSRLGEITCVQTRRGTLQIIKTLASFQLTPVLNCLLSYPLPFDEHVLDWWRTLGQDSHLNQSVIDQFCEIIVRSAPYHEYPDPRNKKEFIRVATPRVLAVVSAMQIMFSLPEMESTATKEYPKLFTILLSVIGCYTNVFSPNVIKDSPKDSHAKPMIVIHSNKAVQHLPYNVAVEAFKAFLTCSNSNNKFPDFESVWEKVEETDNSEVIAFFARFVAVNYPHHLPGFVTCFNPLLSSTYDSQRIVAVAFFAELLNHHNRLDQMALELLLNSMLGRLQDSSSVVRRLAIRGLGSIGKLDVEHMDSLEWFGVYKYSNTVLSAMMSGLDDKEDPHGEIALEAMKGLCKVLQDMEESHVENALVNIIMRLRPCFESENKEIRAAAYQLFGLLARFCKVSEENNHIDQLHGNLICLLLHLNDEDKQVIKSCKSALRSVGPYLGSANVNEMLQKYLIDDCQLYYRDFIGSLCKIMVVDFEERISHYVATSVSYFRSSWPIIKANAALLAGLLLGNIPESLKADVANDATFGALTKLLRDSSPEVRMKAAEAISLLHSY